MAETLGERMAAAETWIDGHEKRCEERLGDIKTDIKTLDERVHKRVDALKAQIGGLTKAAWAVAFALLVFLAKDAYGRLTTPPPPAAIAAVVQAPAAP